MIDASRAGGGDWWGQHSALRGSVAVVTGGAGGLGRAITLDLAANGVSVAVIDRDPAAVAALESDLAGCNADQLVVVGDVRDTAGLDSFFDVVDDRWHRLDTLINVPGGTFRGDFEASTPNGWDALMRANLTHVLHATQRAIPMMKAGGRGGSIVNLTTIEAHRAAPGFAVYSAAKAAVTHFARTLAVELAPHQIRVNCVAPDITPTDNMRAMSGSGPDTLSHPIGVSATIPMGRVGEPSDVSGTVVFLASGLSRYVTGQTLHPDGGTWASSGWINWPDAGFSNTIPYDVLTYMEQRQ